MAVVELFETILFEDPTLKAYYRFNSGALITDDSGNGEILTNNGGIIDGTGKFGNGADLGASNTTDYFSKASPIDAIDNGNFSMMFWMQLQTEIGASEYNLISNQNDGNFIEAYIRYQYNSGTRRLVFARNKGAVANENFTYNIDLGTAAYKHLAITYDGITIRGLVDGSEVGTVAASGNGTSGVADGFAIGATPAGTIHASALFDDVAIFNRQVSNVEIASLVDGTIARRGGGLPVLFP